MKTKNILLISLIVFFMTACFNNNPDDLEEGLLIMDFGQESLPPNLFYTIDLLGPTTRTLEAKSGDNLRVNVAVGTYDITITAYQNLERITPYMRGTTTNANVIAGVNNITINLNVIASVAAPIANPPSGSYPTTQKIYLTGPVGATIYYTLDGSVPSTSSTQYTGGPEGFFFETSGVYTLKAIAVREGLSSSIMERTYTIDFGWTVVENSVNIFGASNNVLVAYGGEKFVAISRYDGILAHSSDGINWTKVGDSGFAILSFSNAIVYGGGKFVLTRQNGMSYSTDGASWTAVADTQFGGLSYNSIEAIAYGGGKFVAGGQMAQMSYSTDGVNWTKVTDSTFDVRQHGIRAIAYGGGKFVAGGWAGQRAYSTDGIKWAKVGDNIFGNAGGNDFTGWILAIAYGYGKFVAGGFGGQMAYSTDGIKWTKVIDSTFGTTDIRVIVYEGGKFIAGGGDGKIAYSTDGINWTAEKYSPFIWSPIGVVSTITYGNNKFVGGWNSGRIAYLRTE
ncbi:MAG: chitobiase/beta-hexosaminidase C-terminal domain-containing protein [Leptospirales bacterium]|nr:chitobiase/beta-hexosaminidase C-terminal domain-containing protein [Leptospirales bacterium]